MSKRTATLPLVLPPREAGSPAARWLYATLRAQILAGRLPAGARLPATRDLARQQGLSRGTVVAAFEQLRAEGYVAGTIGSGTYVNRVLPDELLHVRRAGRVAPAASPAPARHVARLARRLRALPGYERRPTRAFRANVPALDLFPISLWAQIASRRLRRATAQQLLGCDALGYRPLREAVAHYLITSRGAQCVPEQVAIVSGVQEALDLVARLTIDPGDVVCVEHPGYVSATSVFTAYGARVRAVAVDEEGMRVPDGRARGARLAYVTPGHQHPLGMAMSLRRRFALIDWARRAGALILEDDYDSEFRYAARPLPALQGLDTHGVAALTGSFSKVLFPSLRLGYLVVPPDLVDRVAAAKSLANLHTPLLDQAVLCDFITEGHFGRHVRRMREVYAARLGVLLDGTRRYLTGLLDVSGIEAGLQTVGWLAAARDAATVARAAAARRVEVIPLGRPALGTVPREALLLGFAAVDEEEIMRGVRELARVLGRPAPLP
jgi:GntR family transcriptional regulator/MocR family aminotransferase